MKENNKILILIIAFILLAVVAVVFIVGGSRGSEQAIVQPIEVEEVVVVDTEIPAADEQLTADPTQAEVVEDQILPTPRAGLESTDPATVNLATGEIQLIEAFAFW